MALWSGQAELAKSHARAPTASRHAMNRVTARLLVDVERGDHPAGIAELGDPPVEGVVGHGSVATRDEAAAVELHDDG